MNILQACRKQCDLLFVWYVHALWVQKLLFAALGALATAYVAQIKFFLPWTPVPLTMQTLIVVLAGLLLGRRWGLVSQMIYVGYGISGLPLFAGMQGGLSILFGPRGGYLLGFVVTAWILGFVSERLRRFWSLLLVAAIVYVICVYGFGACGLGIWLYAVRGMMPSLIEVFTMGVFPFLIGDAIKIIIAVGIARIVLPQDTQRLKNNMIEES